jgi:pyruvate kinase
MKKTKIICTIGPESEDPRIIEELINCGMNAARLNFSHGDFEEHGSRIDNIKKIRERLNTPIAIMLDTKGPEIRTGTFKEGKVELVQGQQFTFTTRSIVGDAAICHISYENLPSDLKVNDIILVDDGLVGFRVEEIQGTEIICTVMNSGVIGTKKVLTCPG